MSIFLAINARDALSWWVPMDGKLIVPNGNASDVSSVSSHSAVRQRVDGNADVACVAVGPYPRCAEHQVCGKYGESYIACPACVAVWVAGLSSGSEKCQIVNPAETSSWKSHKPVIAGHFIPYTPEVVQEAPKSTLTTQNYCKRTPRMTSVNPKRKHKQ